MSAKRFLSVHIEMPGLTAAVFVQSKVVLVLLEHATGRGAKMVRTARSAEKRLNWLTRLYFALQLEMAAEPAEIVESERGRLELVGLMSALGSAAAERGAGVVRGVKLSKHDDFAIFGGSA
jgi:hypothetical protein